MTGPGATICNDWSFEDMAIRLATIPLLLSTVLLAGCWSTGRPTVDNAANAAPAGIAPPTSLAGKWTLSSAGAGSCTMTFGAPPEATEGTIAPAGGCPYNFFTSRKWNYTTAGLIIRDHNAQQLAQLAPIGDGRFEGKTGAGQDVSLSR
ncbi:MAG: AprI/Inh family metalloprotease inhibitor [Bradyrhizobium sp.]|nr:AprI/Inh family metalloprotease inhibitor [Bradyrhizobium sp.]